MDKQILKKIMFTSAGRRVELVKSFQKASAQLNIPVWIVGADMSNTAPALYFCDEAVSVPRISDANYINVLLNICREKKIDLLIPTIDTDLQKLSDAKEEFLAIGTQVFISAPDKIALCRDKRLTGDFFSSVGLLSPETVDDINNFHGSFPCFIKPLNGSSSINAHRADDYESLKAFACEIGEGNYIIQEFITGTEVTIDIFCDFDSNPVFITPRIRNAVRSGEVLKTTIFQDERMIAEAKKIVAGFKPVGMICAQLIRDSMTGLDYFLEINPRFGGGAPLSAAAGADAMKAAIRLISGEKLSFEENAAGDGLIFSRFDDRICISKSEPVTKHVNDGREVSSYIHRLVEDGAIEGVIFDLDDTLYSEWEYVLNGYREVAKYFDDEEFAFSFMVDSFKHDKPAIDSLLNYTGKNTAEFKQKCVSAYRNQKPEKLTLYPWGVELIKWLKSQNIKLGMITDGRVEGQEAKICATGVDKLIPKENIMITDALGGPDFRKPCDIAYRILSVKFKLETHKIIYIGNNPTKDFKGARAIGMRTLFFDNPECIHTW